MKLKISILVSTLFLFINSNAQVAIGKTSVDAGGLLDFQAGTTKGIILPDVTNSASMTSVSAGTLVFDRASSKIKYSNGTSWTDITPQAETNPTTNSASEKSINQGVIIGDQTSTAKGILVLESPDKALILPKVINPVANVKSPRAGMMCYDPVAKVVCFFNGSNWAFWGDQEK